jgi:chloramphenicol 3-O-phosphotransferase
LQFINGKQKSDCFIARASQDITVSPLPHSFLFLFTATIAADRRDAARLFLPTTTKADDHRRDAQEMRAKAPVKEFLLKTHRLGVVSFLFFCETINPLLCISMLGFAILVMEISLQKIHR